jgi:hypothetical protein
MKRIIFLAVIVAVMGCKSTATPEPMLIPDSPCEGDKRVAAWAYPGENVQIRDGCRCNYKGEYIFHSGGHDLYIKKRWNCYEGSNDEVEILDGGTVSFGLIEKEEGE